MKTKILFILTVFASVVLLLSMNVQGNASNELTAFINNAINQLNAAPVKIPQFDKATIDTIQNLGKINSNTLYLCWLKNEKERTGYIAVAGNGKTFQVVAFSATTAAPDYFLKKLQIGILSSKTLDFSKAKQMSFVDNVPLVAATKTTIGTDTIEISEIAASLSSVFNYLQNKQKIMFFDYLGFSSDPEYTRRFKEDPNSAKYPSDSNWKSLEKESMEAIEKANIPKGQTSQEKINALNQQRNISKPIVRRRLLNPVNARERLEVIRAESPGIVNVTRYDISIGLRDAILLQKDYLDGNSSNLKKNLDIFLKTRGRKAQIEITAFKQLKDDSLPAILIGPDDISAVLLGFMDIDGEKFAFIFFPSTEKPNTMTLADRLRVIGGDKAVADPNKGTSDKARETLTRMRDIQNRSKITEDIPSSFPKSMNSGIHLINSQQLSSWRVLSISKIEIGNNWGN